MAARLYSNLLFSLLKLMCLNTEFELQTVTCGYERL